MGKFKLPNNLRNQQSTSGVSTYREMLRNTNNDLCINIAKLMRDASIIELGDNYKNTIQAWNATKGANPQIPTKELANMFAYQTWKQNATNKALAFITYASLMLVGGEVAKVAVDFVKK